MRDDHSTSEIRRFSFATDDVDHAHDVLKQLEFSARVMGQECDRLRAIRDGAPQGGLPPSANSPTQLLH